MKYTICEQLYKNPSIHCASLVVTQNFATTNDGRFDFAKPSDDLRNGTLTFVKSDGKVFGITCWHVIEHYRSQIDKSGNLDSHSMRTMVNGFYFVLDRFVRPKPQMGMPNLDIAIRELRPDFPLAIGKIPIDLDQNNNLPQRISYGYAIGFPETMKYRIQENTGFRVSMPQVEILAELQAVPTGRFTMFSEIDNIPENIDYSGMSGGPIFWSTSEHYGMLGIVYEGGKGAELSNKSIYVFGELATAEVIKEWIAQVPLR